MPETHENVLGDLAVARGLISSDQLAEALRAIEGDGAVLPLDVVLVSRGWLHYGQVEDLHRAGREALARIAHRTANRAWTWRFARRVVQLGFATVEQVNAALQEQARQSRATGRVSALGDVLVAQGALSREQAAEALRLQGPAPREEEAGPDDRPGSKPEPPPAESVRSGTRFRKRSEPTRGAPSTGSVAEESAESPAATPAGTLPATPPPPGAPEQGPGAIWEHSLGSGIQTTARTGDPFDSGSDADHDNNDPTEIVGHPERASNEMNHDLGDAFPPENGSGLGGSMGDAISGGDGSVKVAAVEVGAADGVGGARSQPAQPDRMDCGASEPAESVEDPAPAQPEAESSGEAPQAPLPPSTVPPEPADFPAPAVAVASTPRVDPAPQSGANPGPDASVESGPTGDPEQERGDEAPGAAVDPPSPQPPLAALANSVLAAAAAATAAETLPPSHGNLGSSMGASDETRTSERLDRVAARAAGHGLSPTDSALPDDQAPTFPGSAIATVAPGDPTDVGGADLPRIGRYRILSELGRGGMGVVYLAYDEQMRREVALKTVHGGEAAHPRLVERLLREARTAGALDHPGIVRIYDVGEVGGVTYFAMAYVKGRTLRAALAAKEFPTLRDRVVALHAAAAAVAHAHERQVIHRDLKPGNILLDGEGRVHVLDFGLARHLEEGTRITASGESMGTPAYMPPEQALGEASKVGPAADVYALGAILYEVLTGHPPFEGANAMEVLARLVHEDPRPPRLLDARIPEDLETICLRALRREPERRYPTAGPLADDLGRWLRGEAIAARRETAIERAMRWLRRHRALAALAAAVLVALTVTAVAGVQAAAERREKDRLGREVLGALREMVGCYFDSALLVRRAGGGMAEVESRFLGPLQQAAARVVAQAPDLAEPHVHLGRFHRVILRFDEARAELDRALAKDPDHAVARYESVVLLVRACAERAERLRRERRRDDARRAHSGAPARPRPTLDDLAGEDEVLRTLRSALREEVARMVRQAQSPARPGADVIPRARLDGARGLQLVYASARTEDFAEARRLLGSAVAADPTLVEAHEAIAQLESEEKQPERALAACDAGLAIDRGYVPLLILRGGLLHDRAYALFDRGENPDPTLVRAEADFTRALELQPGDPRAWLGRSRVRGDQAWYTAEAGDDSTALWEAAESDALAAVRLDPGDASAWTALAQWRRNRGEWLQERGVDPEPAWTQAEADLAQALVADPNSAEAFGERSMLLTSLAILRLGQGGDGAALFARADEDMVRAMKLGHTRPEVWSVRGDNYLSWGSALEEAGQDPREALLQAEAACGRALELEPALIPAAIARADVRLALGAAEKTSAAEAREWLEKARSDLDRVLERSPGHFEARIRRGMLRHQLEEWSGAAEDFAEAARRHPGSETEFQQEWDDARERAGLKPK